MEIVVMSLTVNQIVEHFNLEPHIEGGYFKEIYRSKTMLPQSALPEGFHGERHASTGIFYLLPQGAKSKLHKIPSDEMWHFYLGGPMTIVEISDIGEVKKTRLGHDIQNGCQLNYVVPGGVWFGAYPDEGTEFSLVGCTVAPGFDFADFEMGDEEKLIQCFPHVRDLITMLMA